MPETTGVILDSFKSIGFKFVGLFIVVGCFCVFYDFDVGSSYVCENPAGVEVVLGEFFELFDGLLAVVPAKLVESVSHFLE